LSHDGRLLAYGDDDFLEVVPSVEHAEDARRDLTRSSSAGIIPGLVSSVDGRPPARRTLMTSSSLAAARSSSMPTLPWFSTSRLLASRLLAPRSRCRPS
jgi:hypothetical protein